jgi:hypothetical protein
VASGGGATETVVMRSPASWRGSSARSLSLRSAMPDTSGTRMTDATHRRTPAMLVARGVPWMETSSASP